MSPLAAFGFVMQRATENNDPRLRVFLCHASDDKPAVRDLYTRLSSLQQLDVWLDEEKLLPDQEWEHEIKRAIRASHVIIVCLSQTSILKEGYVQKEQREALEVAKEKPEGTIFLIPARLDDCEVLSQLRQHHWANLFDPKGYDRLVSALRVRASHVGITFSVQEPASVPDQPESPARSVREKIEPAWSVNDVIAAIERVRSIPDRNQQLLEAELAAASMRAQIKDLDLWDATEQLQKKLMTTAHVALTDDALVVLSSHP